MFKHRLISSFILMLTVIIILFRLSLCDFVIAMITVCTTAAWEWSRISGINKNMHRFWITALFSLLLLIVTFVLEYYQFSANQSNIDNCFILLSLGWWSIVIFLIIFYPSSAILWKTFLIIRLVCGIFILIPFFYSMIKVRLYQYNINYVVGSWWLLFVLLIVWATDCGAYIFGKCFGRHKFALKISPNKTWEGVLGGFVCSIIVSYLFFFLAPLHIYNSQRIIIFTFFITIASIIGDLTESMFKRNAGIKDSSNLIPGHGGILDRIDGLTAAVPIAVCLLLLFLVSEDRN